MSYKTELQKNNADLAAILNTVNALPEATEPKEPVIEGLNVTANGTYTAPDGVDGYSPVTVNVEGFTPPDSEYLDPNEVYRTTRPSDWLPMPTPGDDEIYLLGQLVEGIDNKFSIRLHYSGTCTVEIGTVVDGEFVAKQTLPVASNTAFSYIVPWDEYGDTTSDGYRQYMVKCKGKITYCRIDGELAGTSSVVDCVIGIPNLWFVGGKAGNVRLACQSLRYLRFVGNGYPFCTNSLVSGCSLVLCVSCEKQLTNSPYSTYGFDTTPNLIAISPELVFSNNDSSWAFASSGLRRIPTKNFHPTTLAHCFRGANIAFLDGSTFGNCGYFAAAFYDNKVIKEIVNLDITNAFDFEIAFDYCSSLEKLTFAGTTARGGYTINLSACKLSHTALVNMIASLPTATNAATITITNNPGASELTADEIAVATAKNWTITI